jgi:hypothetical protein
LRLSARARALLAEALLESLDDDAMRGVQTMWGQESETRLGGIPFNNTVRFPTPDLSSTNRVARSMPGCFMRRRLKDRIFNILLIVLFLGAIAGSGYYIYRTMTHWSVEGLG